MNSHKLLQAYLERTVPRCGIYKIVNSVTEEIYIGSSKHLQRRKKNFLSDARAGKCSRRLQLAVDQYGIDCFHFIEIECCAESALTKREQYYIDSLHPFYNSHLVAVRG